MTCDGIARQLRAPAGAISRSLRNWQDGLVLQDIDPTTRLTVWKATPPGYWDAQADSWQDAA